MRRGAIAMVLVIVACTDLGGLNGGGAPTGVDAGSDGSVGADAGACTVLYVSPAGNDSGDGCSPSAPLRTLAHAIDVARQGQLVAGEIHACRGVYQETLRLDYPVSLVGSFDCASWQPDVLAAPTWLATTTVKPSAATDPTTVTVTGPVGRDIRIEGVEIDGPLSGTQSGTALSIEGASPTVVHSRIVGGTTQSAANEAGSVGLYVRTGAGPLIRESFVDGGRGTGTGLVSASVGIRSRDGGDVLIEGCHITGGRGNAGTANLGTVGLFVKGGKPVVIRDSEIDGGLGTSQGGGGVGVFVQIDASAQIVGNTISGGGTTSSTPTGTPSSIGILIGGTALLDRNRVTGGAAPADATGQAVAIDLQSNSHDVVITNNAIHGGTARVGGGGAQTSAIGVTVEGGSTNDSIRFNSIYTGQVGTAAGAATGIVVAPGVKNIRIDDNLIFGDARTNGLWIYECGTTIGSVKGNAFFSLPTLLRRVSPSTAGGPCDTTSDDATISDMVTTLTTDFPTASIADNLGLARAPGPACIGTVLASWDSPSFGMQNFLADGFKLSPTVSCAIAKGCATAQPDVTVDLTGAPRTAPLSLGANETETCVP